MAHGDSKIIVIGCGKRLSGDDSAALEVLSRLHDVPDLGCELRTYEEGCPLGFLAEIPADALVVFIDSVRSKAEPGTIHCQKLPSKPVAPGHLGPVSRHIVDIEGEIAVAQKLHGASPRLFLLAIEVDNCAPGPELSSKVMRAVEEIVNNFPRYRKLAHELA